MMPRSIRGSPISDTRPFRNSAVRSLSPCEIWARLRSPSTAPMARRSVSRRLMVLMAVAAESSDSCLSMIARISVESSSREVGSRSDEFSNQAAASGNFSNRLVANREFERTCVIRSAAPLESRNMRRYQCDSPRSSESLLKASRAWSGSEPSANHCIKPRRSWR